MFYHFPIFLLVFFLSLHSYAEDQSSLQPIEVYTPKEHDVVDASDSSLTKVSSDTASLLKMVPGISLQTGGGISSLPVIQGMADDRVNIKVDGANITSACSNHMNPALSYIDPTKVSTIDIMAGITPVSFGGDSIGGSIVVNSKPLQFSEDVELKQLLNLRSYFKSNNENQGAALQYSLATSDFYFGYSGFDEKANNYRSGSGERVKGTLYNQNNQTVTVGKKLNTGILSLKASHTIIPYQGFVNQRMDMADNVSNLANLSFKGMLGDLYLDTNVYYQHTNHYMDILSSQRSGSMPMYTRSDEAGYSAKASFDFDKNHFFTLGSDFNRYRLDDWWPALPDVTMIMGPGTFQSINQGKRDRLGLFVESDSNWSGNFSTNFGVRSDIVSMNTGNVHGYNDTDNLPADALSFNQKSHSKTDHNYDATLISKLKINPNFDFHLGLGRKTRSPNLYERFAWAGSVTDPTDPMDMNSMGASMDMLMINWFGDGNGYVGNINLRPEVAQKVSASFIAHDEGNKDWEVRLTPYYSKVNNFIDADLIGKSMGANYLRFANHDATIFGSDLSVKSSVLRHNNFGDVDVKVIASYTKGYRRDGKADLYHIMPLNGKVLLEHSSGKWKSDLVAYLVDKKKQVNELRSEPVTPGYAIFDIGTSYNVTKLIRIDLGVSNLLDHKYGLPLGGVDLVNRTIDSRSAVSGMGRSVNGAVSVDFF